MKTAPKLSAPAGWYQAPGEAFTDRYRDGSAWTDQSRPRPTQFGTTPSSGLASEAPSKPRLRDLAAVGLGATLLVAAAFTYGRADHAAGLLAPLGTLLVGIGGALLRNDVRNRTYSIVCIWLGIAIVAGCTIAALVNNPLALIPVAAALIFVITSFIKIRRLSRQHASN